MDFFVEIDGKHLAQPRQQITDIGTVVALNIIEFGLPLCRNTIDEVEKATSFRLIIRKVKINR